MSRKVIKILFIIGSCLYIPGMALIIWGYVSLFQAISAQQAYYSSYSGYSSPSTPDGLGTFMGLLIGGALIGSLGGIVLLVARIGALIELGKAQEWVWFILVLLFGWIVLLIYLIAGPKPKPAPQYALAYPYPYPAPGQYWPNYPPPAPGMMPPPGQPWPNYPPPAPGMMPPPEQPWPSYPPPAE